MFLSTMQTLPNQIPAEKVLGKVFVSKKWLKWLYFKVIWRSQCGISV